MSAAIEQGESPEGRLDVRVKWQWRWPHAEEGWVMAAVEVADGTQGHPNPLLSPSYSPHQG